MSANNVYVDLDTITISDIATLKLYLDNCESILDLSYPKNNVILTELMGWEANPLTLDAAREAVNVKYNLLYKTSSAQFDSVHSGETVVSSSGERFNPSTIVHGLSMPTKELKKVWAAVAESVSDLSVKEAATLFQLLQGALRGFVDPAEKMGVVVPGISELRLSSSIAPLASVIIVAESSFVKAAYEKGVPLSAFCGRITMTNNDTTVVVHHDHIEGDTEQFEKGLTLGGAQINYKGSVRVSMATDILLASAHFANGTWTPTQGFTGSRFAQQFLTDIIEKMLKWFNLYGKPPPGQAATIKIRPHAADRMCEFPHLDFFDDQMMKKLLDIRTRMEMPVFAPIVDEEDHKMIARFGRQYGNVSHVAYAAQLTSARTFRGPNQPLSHGMAATMAAAPEEYDVVLTYERIFRICLQGKIDKTKEQIARVHGKNTVDFQAYLKSRGVPLYTLETATSAMSMVLNPPNVQVLIDEGMSGQFKDRMAWIQALTNAKFPGDVVFRARHSEISADLETFSSLCYNNGWLPIAHKIGRLHNQEVLVRLVRRPKEHADIWKSTITRFEVSLAMITTVAAAVNLLMSQVHTKGIRFDVSQIFDAMLKGLTAVAGFGQYLEPIEITAPKAMGPGALVALSSLPVEKRMTTTLD